VNERELPKVFLLQFNPETWSYLHKLHAFVGPPLPNNANVRIGLRDCESHLNKVIIWKRVADRLRPNLAIDREELERLGGTSNAHSQEFAAVCESTITALYSALDGLRTFLFGTYGHVQHVQNGSNQKLFERAKANTYGKGFPEEIRHLLAGGWDTWFGPLCQFRTELTHGSTGTCHLDPTTQRIAYFNEGIKKGDGCFHLEDIENYLRETDEHVRTFVENICSFHFRQLEAKPQFKMCGMYRGRWYGRMVAPTMDLSFRDGHCLSYDWFEREEGYFCPLANECPAYQQKWPGGSAAVSGGT
jgi:hypothetical protein